MMDNTINGRTPDEIKKGLEYYAETDLAKKLNACKQGLKYWYAEDVAADALAYIQQLERERDAAVEAAHGSCLACSHYHYNVDVFGHCINYELCEHGGDVWEGKDLWQWRGVQNDG